MNDLEPLDPKLRELLSREHDAYAEDSFAREAVLRRIQTAVALAPLAVGAGASVAAAAQAAGTSTAAAAKVAAAKAGVAAAIGWKGAALVAVVAFGGGVAVGEVHRSMSDGPPPSVVSSSPIMQTSTLPPPVPALTPSGLPIAEPTAAPLLPTPSATSPAPTARSPAGGPNDERALVEIARAALARGRSADALTAIEEHAKRYPRGRLAEEREAIAVQALALAGDREGALTRAARFRRVYPNSIFGPGVDRAVSSFADDRSAPP